jgi:plasmid rolling circle replication initiator protein Rep
MNNTTSIEKMQVDFLEKPTAKKIKSSYLADLFFSIFKDTSFDMYYKKSLLVRNCGTFLEFKTNPTNGKTVLSSANFCKSRLCPMCNWRLSLKRFANLSEVMEQAKQQKFQFLFLTLTVQNSKGEDLKKTISAMLKSFNSLTKYKDFGIIKGYFRAVEVTYNRTTNEFHPHIHVILAIKNTYFNSKYYISQEKWAQLWQQALSVDYMPIVDIRKAYTKKGKQSAEAEASKYTVKDSDYLINDDTELAKNVLTVYDSALKGARLVAYGGVLKEIAKQLELEEDNLTDDITDELLYILKKYRWNIGLNKYQEYN